MKSYSPTTPSRRHITNVTYRGVLTKNVARDKSLTKRLKTHSGRNSQGRITMRHQGGGNKKLYRVIDFVQNKLMSALVESIEYDPYRSGFIAKIRYEDGTRAYILAPHSITAGTKLETGDSAPVTPGNRMKLKNIPVGYQVHNIETNPGRGGKFARSAGSYGEVLAHAGKYTDIKFASGAVRHVLSDCFASVGQVSNIEHNLVNIGKAGRSRWLGIRPTVRGSVMNPVDHPYGGGEGRQPRGTRKPKTLWGKVTGGRRTRNKRKWSNKLIVKRRK